MKTRIFLTGASGFVGAALAGELLACGNFEISALLREPEKSWRLNELLGRLTCVVGSLDDRLKLENHFASYRPDVVIDLAWQGVAGSERNSSVQWRNIGLHLELLELGKKYGVKRWIGLGSQAEYGPCERRISESTETRPTTLYGVSKLALCQLTQKICDDNFISCAWVRLFSSYGPRDNTHWLIPYLIQSLIKGDAPDLTAAEQLWDYIYIDDLVAAISSLVLKADATGIFNVGSGSALPLKYYVETIRNAIDPSLHIGFGKIPYRSDQVMHLEADVQKLSRATGWKPRADPYTSILKTVDWYRKGVS